MSKYVCEIVSPKASGRVRREQRSKNERASEIICEELEKQESSRVCEGMRKGE